MRVGLGERGERGELVVVPRCTRWSLRSLSGKRTLQERKTSSRGILCVTKLAQY